MKEHQHNLHLIKDPILSGWRLFLQYNTAMKLIASLNQIMLYREPVRHKCKSPAG